MARALVGTEGTCAVVVAATVRLVADRTGFGAAGPRLRRRRRRRRGRAGDPAAGRPPPSRAWTRRSSPPCAPAAARTPSPGCPRGGPGCTSSSTATTRPRSPPARRELLDELKARGRMTGRPGRRRARPSGARCGGSARTAPGWPPACVDGGESWPGWEDAAVAPENLAGLPAGLPRTARRPRAHRRALRALRRGLRPRAHRLRLRHGHRPRPPPAASSSRPPRWSSGTAGRCRASTATAGRAVSCWRSCTATG